MTFDYNHTFENALNQLRSEGRYRVFNNITRKNGEFPKAVFNNELGIKSDVTIWCSNDYLGMGQNPEVIEAFVNAAAKAVGAGAGGTRNISGTSSYHVELERELCKFHHKEAALIFTSGYIANECALSTLARFLPGCIVYSDANNHASMIEGIKNGRSDKHIWRHNDVDHLEFLLKQSPKEQPKIVAFESVYSMDGDLCPIKDIIRVSKKYNALTYLDEVHGVGLYGDNGGGLSEKMGVTDELDIIEGTLAKGFGIMGGYIAANKNIADIIRSFAPGFIFTTSMPPSIAAAAIASIRVVKNNHSLRLELHERANKLKQLMLERNLPIIKNDSHIVPLLVRDSARCKEISDILLNEFSIYVQPINYPTVPKGTERLRFTPTPYHDNQKMQYLVDCLDQIWSELKLSRAA
jgi:5-aminolevulinate synthase